MDSLDGFSIIIAVRNEAKNIPILMNSLFELKKGSNYSFEVIFVDDESDDGTSDIISNYISDAKKNGIGIHLIRRIGKRGTVGAQIDGSQIAKFDYVIIMDGDLQHPMEFINSMIERVDEGTDLVIASRRIEDGKSDLKLSRLMISTIARMLSYLLIPQTRVVSDPLSGFFICRRTNFIKLYGFHNYNKLLLYILASNNNLIIKELPFRMKERANGNSKVAKNKKKMVLHFLRELKKYHTLQRERKRYNLNLEDAEREDLP